MNLMSSTLLSEDTGVPFDELQAEQIARYRAAWAEAGWEHEPRVSVSRSVLPITSDLDRQYFGSERGSGDQVGILEGVRARFGKSYVGEPDQLAEELAKDAAVRDADTLLITVPNMLGVDYNAHLLETVTRYVAPAIGWVPPTGPLTRRASVLRHRAGAGELLGDVEQLAVGVAGGLHQHGERLRGGQPEPLHQDALRLADEVPPVDRRAQVALLRGPRPGRSRRARRRPGPPARPRRRRRALPPRRGSAHRACRRR